MVTNAITEYESKNFFTFLTKENPNAVTRDRRYLLDEKSRHAVFMKIMCNAAMLDCAKIGTEGFSCFKMLFLNVNAESKCLTYNSQKDSFSVVDVACFQKLQGFDTLQSIAIESKNPKVSNESRNFYVDIYLHTKVESKHKRKFTEHFLSRMERIHI